MSISIGLLTLDLQLLREDKHSIMDKFLYYCGAKTDLSDHIW